MKILMVGVLAITSWVATVVRAESPRETPVDAYARQDPVQLAEFRQAIRIKYDLKEKAFAEGDAETIVRRFYAGDELTVASRDAIYFGRDDILPVYRRDTGKNKVRIESFRTYVNGDAGWDWADFHVFPTDGSKPFTLAILFLWSKIDGEWVCMGDFFDFGSFQKGKLESPPAP